MNYTLFIKDGKICYTTSRERLKWIRLQQMGWKYFGHLDGWNIHVGIPGAKTMTEVFRDAILRT